MREKSLFLILWLLCVNCVADASQTYHQAVVPVRSQSNTDRQYAAQKGLQEVLVRMSGSGSVLANERIQKAVGRAQSFIEQFGYRLVEDEELKKKGYLEEMHLVFSAELVERLLFRDARVPYWPPNRPQVLVWLVEDNERRGRQILNRSAGALDDTEVSLVAALDKAARDRGLPTKYPLLDLEDQMAISASKLWQMNEQAILQASSRYDAPVVLVGRFSTTSRGEIWSSWQYFHQGFSHTWDSRSPNLDELATEALKPLNAFLVERYAVVPGGGEGSSPRLVMHLSGIESFKHYRQALDYLDGLAMITDIQLLEVSQGEMLLALQSEATLSRFKTTVQLDQKIRFIPPEGELPVWQQLPEGTMENPVRFGWRGS